MLKTGNYSLFCSKFEWELHKLEYSADYKSNLGIGRRKEKSTSWNVGWINEEDQGQSNQIPIHLHLGDLIQLYKTKVEQTTNPLDEELRDGKLPSLGSSEG